MTRYGDPIWATVSAEAEAATEPCRDAADVVVIGAGITGLSTALHAAQAGLDVQVIEAKKIASGGSGRNVGLVNAGVWMPPSGVRAALGADRGERFLETFGAAPGRVFDLVETHQIRCDATRAGTVHAARSVSGMSELRARAADWQALGAPVHLLDARAVAQMSGAVGFHGGLVDARAGTINPAAYSRGLARAAAAAGARIATGTRALRLSHRGTAWEIQIPQTRIRAPQVVIAANAYADALWPELSRSFTTIRFVQVATEPLGPRGAGILPEGQGLWDTGRIMRSVRRDRDGRLVLGTMGPLLGTAERGATRRWALTQIRTLFPRLGEVKIADAWEGRIAMTRDHLPRLHAPAPGLWIPTAYNGRGITTGTVFGAALADILAGGDPDRFPVPVTTLGAEPWAGMRGRVFAAGFVANQFAGSLVPRIRPQGG